MSREGADTPSPRELNTEEALSMISQIAEVNPEVMLILSGGEPLLRKDIFDLAAYAHGKGMMVVLGTNGLLVDDGVAASSINSGITGVSVGLDSVNPLVHDEIRLFDGAWEGAVKAIGICKSHGLSVQVNSVVTAMNYKELPELIRFSADLGAKVFSPFFLVCTGRGEELTDITPYQYEEILSFIAESRGKYDGMIIRTRCAPTFRRILYQKDRESSLLKMGTGRCMAGKNYCRITPQGDVSPCPYMRLSVGNVVRSNFKDIWANSEVFGSLRRNLLKGKCGMCEFRLICGGCRARAYAANGDFTDEDPWCAFTPQGGEVMVSHDFDVPLAGDPEAFAAPLWTREAEERLKRVPFFVRDMVRGAAESFAVERGYREITPEIMEELKRKAGRMGIGHQ